MPLYSALQDSGRLQTQVIWNTRFVCIFSPTHIPITLTACQPSHSGNRPSFLWCQGNGQTTPPVRCIFQAPYFSVILIPLLTHTFSPSWLCFSLEEQGSFIPTCVRPCFLDSISHNPYFRHYLERPPVKLGQPIHTGSITRMCQSWMLKLRCENDAFMCDADSHFMLETSGSEPLRVYGAFSATNLIPSTYGQGYEDILDAISIVFRDNYLFTFLRLSVASPWYLLLDPRRSIQAFRLHAHLRLAAPRARCPRPNNHTSDSVGIYMCRKRHTCSTDRDGKYPGMNKEGRNGVYIHPVTGWSKAALNYLARTLNIDLSDLQVYFWSNKPY